MFDYYVSVTGTVSLKYYLFNRNNDIILSGSKSYSSTSTAGYDYNSRDKPKDTAERARYYSVKESIEILMNKIISEISSDEKLLVFEKNLLEKNTEPSRLAIACHFNDDNSLVPNLAIDSGEQSVVDVIISNNGKGTAFDVKLAVQSLYYGLQFPDEIVIGDIQPGDSKNVTIPVNADLSLSSGTASFLINAHEKRGYDAQPVEFQIPARTLNAPEFDLASCGQSDSTAGLAAGDGDNALENNETIELAPFINNKGVGGGIGVKVTLDQLSDGLEVIKGEDDLGALAPGSSGRATLAYKIPRTFSGTEISYRVVVSDARGLKTEQTYSFPFRPQAPALSYTSQLVDTSHREVPALENGGAYLLNVTPGNRGENVATGVSIVARGDSGKISIGAFRPEVGTIPAGGRGPIISIPVVLSRSFVEKDVRIRVTLNQDDFPGLTDTIILPVMVKQPALVQDVALLNGVNIKSVSQNFWPRFRVSVNNNGNLDAENVRVVFSSKRADIPYEQEEVLGTIRAGESQYKDFTFFVRGDAAIGELPVSVRVEQAEFAGLTEPSVFQVTRQIAIVQKVEAMDSGPTVGSAIPSRLPEIYVNSLNQNSETYKELIDLHGSLISFGPGNGIEQLEVLLNGEPLTVIPVNEDIRFGQNRLSRKTVDNKVIFDGQVALKPGGNEITIRGRDRSNLTAEKILHVTRKAKLGNIYAVVVGVSEFADPTYNLKYAASDAVKFRDFLRSEMGGNLPDKRAKLLTDSSATRAAMIDAFSNFLGMATRDDTVEIYIATHGVIAPDGILYFLTRNSDVNNLRGTALSNNEFIDIVANNIRAGRVLIYLDVCHAGMSDLSPKLYAKRGIGVYEVNNKVGSLAAEISRLAADMGSRTTGVKTFSASSADGSSLEDSSQAGGIFTYYLLNGLHGAANEDQDEWVTIGELDTYVTREVMAHTLGKQKPEVKGPLADEIPISKVR